MGSAIGTRSFAWISLLAWLCASAPVAHAQRLAGELRLGGGWDSNPALAAPSGNRRLPQGRSPGGPPRPGESAGEGVFRAAGALEGQLPLERLRLGARFDLDGRVYESGRALFAERLAVSAALDLDPIAPRCRAEGGRLDSGFGADDAWSVLGRCGARLLLPEGFAIDLDGFGGARLFDVGQTDALGGGALAVLWRHAHLDAAIGLEVWRRESDDDQATRTDVVPYASVRLRTEWVGGELAYQFVQREFDTASRTGGEHELRLAVWGQPLPWLGPWLAIELGHASGKPQALAYDRFEIALGLRLSFDVAEPPPEPPSEPPPDDGPVTVRDGAARFRFAIDAREVSVIGDFNGWDARRGALTRGPDGAFEGTFEVSPGAHRYHLLVDGAPTRPPGARRYVDDGFGGENAVFEAPGVSDRGPDS